MRVYETILSILEEKGPLPIAIICYEVNLVLSSDREKPILPSHIKSIVTRKRELFIVNEGNISIDPDKHPFSLIATLEGFEESSYQVHVNFIKNRFVALEWRNKDNCQPFSDVPVGYPGDIEEFKRELYTMNIWKWEPTYQDEAGIILEGKYWSVKLKTKGKIYKSEGSKSYPANWNHFCKALEKLTGTPFH